METEDNINNSHLLSQEIKWLIVHYIKTKKYSYQKTAAIVSEECNRPTLSRQTVKAVWLRYEKTKKIDNNWNQKGRPQILNEEDFEDLNDYFTETPKNRSMKR